MPVKSLADTPFWPGFSRARSRQRFFGWSSAIFLFLASLALLDGVQALMRQGPDFVELLPGGQAGISGNCPFRNPVTSDVRVEFLPEDAPLSFALSGFFTGYWLGNGMWRGVLRAADSARPGRFAVRVLFKGAPLQTARVYHVAIFADQSALKAGSASYLFRLSGCNAFVMAAVCAAIGLVSGLCTYLLGRGLFRLLAGAGVSEVYRVASGDACHVWCLWTAPGNAVPGQTFSLYAADGAYLGRGRMIDLRKGMLELTLPEGLAARPGSFVLLRSADA